MCMYSNKEWGQVGVSCVNKSSPNVNWSSKQTFETHQLQVQLSTVTRPLLRHKRLTTIKRLHIEHQGGCRRFFWGGTIFRKFVRICRENSFSKRGMRLTSSSESGEVFKLPRHSKGKSRGLK